MKTSLKGFRRLVPKSKKQDNKIRKIKVAVLMGGKSPEYEISLISGKEVVKNLNPKKYDVLPIVVSKDGVTWQIEEKGRFLEEFHSVDFSSEKQVSKSLSTTNYSALVKTNKIDVVFIAMHGPFGEDGTVQGFLELIGVPYTGSGVLASALGMDKISSRKLFTQTGLKTPRYMILEKGQKIKNLKFKFPVFVKPSNQGSSIGTTKVRTKKQLANALKLAFSYSRFALIEEFLEGVEVTGSILGNDKPLALPLVEIVPNRQFFDYNAKYFDNQTKEIVPARLSNKMTKKAQSAALQAYKSLDCKGFGRVDMIIKNDEAYVLEVNTIPGLTPMSLMPKAAKAAGISYPQLLDKIIHFAITDNSSPIV